MEKFKSVSSLFALTALFAMVFIVGCQKEAMVENPDTADVQKVDANTAYILGPDGFQPVGMNELQNLKGQRSLIARNNGNSHVNAHFSIQPFQGTTEGTLQINATQNNQGVSGVAIGWLTQVFGGVTYTYQLNTDAVCMFSNGEEAVVVGEITNIIGNAPPFIVIGLLISMKVIDNGQGANAPADQYNRAIIIHCPCNTDCNTFALGHPVWELHPDLDVLNASDYINVK